MKILELKYDYHRNGVGGAPFYAISFKADNRRMVATWFPEWDEEGNLTDAYERFAVLDNDSLPDIRFLHNSWRGDHFAYEIIPMIRYREENPQPTDATVAELRAWAAGRKTK